MIAIPTLELRKGVAARSASRANGDTARAVDGPIAAVRSWATTGFRRAYVIDLDAEHGLGSTASVVEDVIRDGALDVQVGGGVQSTETIERLVEAGAWRVVVGSRALDEPDWLDKVADLFPGTIVVSTEVHERRVITRGWVRSLPLDVLDLAADLNGLPLGGLVVGSLQSDSQRAAIELALIEDIAGACEFPVIAAGGVSTMQDLHALENRGVAAALLGKALHSGALDGLAVAREFDA